MEAVLANHFEIIQQADDVVSTSVFPPLAVNLQKEDLCWFLLESLEQPPILVRIRKDAQPCLSYRADQYTVHPKSDPLPI